MKKIFFALCILALMVFAPVFALAAETFDTTSANFFKEGTWTSSSLKTEAGNKTYLSTVTGAKAGWTVEVQEEKEYAVYFRIPTHTSSPNVTGTITVKLGNVEKSCEIKDVSYMGWVYLGTHTFKPDTENMVYIQSTGRAYARVSDLKLDTPIGAESYVVLPRHFNTFGGFSLTTTEGAYQGNTMCMELGGSNDPAVAKLDVENGTYYVYMHTCDFPDYQPATRLLKLNINGTEYRKNENTNKSGYFGSFGLTAEDPNPESEHTSAWDFEKMTYPSESFSVEDGVINLELHKALNTSFGRTDAIVITKIADFVPLSVSHVEMACVAPDISSDRYRATMYPEYGKAEQTENVSALSISNDHVTVNFKQGTTADGKTTVQRETKIGNTVVNNYTDGLGYMVVYAEQADPIPAAYPILYRTNYRNASGELINIQTRNIYSCGENSWLVPSSMRKISDSEIEISGENDYASFKAIWSLSASDKEPKVSVTFTTKKEGNYSFGMYNNVNDLKNEDVESVLMPFDYQEKRIPPAGELTIEATLTTPLSQISLLNKNLSVGVAVDSDSLDYRWVRRGEKIDTTDINGNPLYMDLTYEQTNFGMALTDIDGDILPALFAPVMGSYDGRFSAEDTYTFTYRPVATVGDWYAGYKHVVRDIVGFYDYRENYFCSMTDTAFNLYELLMDDYYSGWDENAKAHYNMEDSYWVSNSDGLAYLQFYLLTEDKEMLERRVLPQMAYLLGRSSAHMWYKHSGRDNAEGPIQRFPLGGIGTMGNSTYAGAYLMTRGQMPVYRAIASSGLRNTYVRAGQAHKIYNPSEYLWLSRMTDGNLSETVSKAEEYMKYGVYVQKNNDTGDEFSNRVIYPQYQSMLELYEETGEQKYLDAAINAAQKALPTFWCMPMPEKDVMEVYDDAEIHKFWMKAPVGAWMYWRGNFYERLGIIDVIVDNKAHMSGIAETALKQSSEPIPQWVAARPGLGLEGEGTYNGDNQNILLSTWAGELLRLGYLANDPLMMDFARTSVVGRYANYPGYYYEYFRTYIGEKDFPYKGPDTSNLYYHHIPVQLTLVQDYLFANAYVLSDGKVDFPDTRTQGYAWFNNRHYGSDAGTVYNETEMWPWLKKGTITIDNKQIDWIGARKDKRVAFVLTNASKTEQQATVTFDANLGVANTVLVYDKAGNTSTLPVTNGKVTVTLPAMGIVTLAADAENVKAPAISAISFEKADYLGKNVDLSEKVVSSMLGGNTYSAETGYDINAYTLQIEPGKPYAYVNAGFQSTAENAENGIDKLVISYNDGTGEKTATDESFPFEFILPMDDETPFTFTATAYRGENAFASEEMTLSGANVELEPEAFSCAYDTNTKTATITSLAQYNDAKIVAVSYQNGVMKDCKRKDKDIVQGDNTVSFTDLLTDNVTEIKIVIWKSDTQFEPLCEVCTVDLTK
ncbi:MAG: hypothetical protein IJE10_01090 [Clostridia bacterium]|nr:hypothetical protein [Clostridia bacterium]